MNDNEVRPVTIITGRVWRRKGGDSEGVHVLLIAPDDDSAVRIALESLAREGYAEAEFDQIGDLDGVPDDEPHLSAYQGALEGEVSIVTFDEPA
ncbi:MAG: transcriptional regulator [Mesorhizobium sp.]